ncbi:inositol monophosphatase family protein [Rapidithrix thailandica]|uniref:Inositol-1-monophosphatase n=1 Tax=Rapidithrix thailandica TaxID=413964 RepID=A0AAW9S2E0_9BACT
MDLKKTTQQVIQISKEVRKFIISEFNRFDADAVEYKGLNDLVSYVDKESEKQLVKGLGEILPEAGFIAEEGTGSRNASGYNWIIDPLDGTTNFIHGLPVFAISIALMSPEEEILIGVVHDVCQDHCYWAAKGEGAYRNDTVINVSSEASLSKSLIATGFPYYAFEKMPLYIKVLEELMQKTHGLRRMGAAAIDLAFVACGRFESFFEYNLKPWDVAAGILLVKEAGGVVSDFKNGNNCIFGKEIIASGHVHQDMQEIIARNFYQ